MRGGFLIFIQLLGIIPFTSFADNAVIYTQEAREKKIELDKDAREVASAIQTMATLQQDEAKLDPNASKKPVSLLIYAEQSFSELNIRWQANRIQNHSKGKILLRPVADLDELVDALQVAPDEAIQTLFLGFHGANHEGEPKFAFAKSGSGFTLTKLKLRMNTNNVVPVFLPGATIISNACSIIPESQTEKTYQEIATVFHLKSGWIYGNSSFGLGYEEYFGGAPWEKRANLELQFYSMVAPLAFFSAFTTGNLTFPLIWAVSVAMTNQGYLYGFTPERSTLIQTRFENAMNHNIIGFVRKAP